MAKHSGLAVVELRSRDNRTGSLRNLYELISECSFEKPYEFSCEIVSTSNGLKDAMARWSRSEEIRYLCIAGHGSKDGVILDHGKTANAGTIGKSLISRPSGNDLVGCHFSTCYTVNPAFSRALLKTATSLLWVSGYNSAVDWIQSLAMDMLFLRLILDNFENENEEKLIRRVAKSIQTLAPGLHKSLGMRIFLAGPDGQIINLLDPK